MSLWPFSLIDSEGRPALNHADGVYRQLTAAEKNLIWETTSDWDTAVNESNVTHSEGQLSPQYLTPYTESFDDGTFGQFTDTGQGGVITDTQSYSGTYSLHHQSDTAPSDRFTIARHSFERPMQLDEPISFTYYESADNAACALRLNANTDKWAAVGTGNPEVVYETQPLPGYAADLVTSPTPEYGEWRRITVSDFKWEHNNESLKITFEDLTGDTPTQSWTLDHDLENIADVALGFYTGGEKFFGNATDFWIDNVSGPWAPEGALTTATKSFNSPEKANVTNMTYSGLGTTDLKDTEKVGDAVMDVVASPGTADEERVPIRLDGQSEDSVASRLNNEHTDYQLDLSLEPGADGPNIDSVTLGTEDVPYTRLIENLEEGTKPSHYTDLQAWSVIGENSNKVSSIPMGTFAFHHELEDWKDNTWRSETTLAHSHRTYRGETYEYWLRPAESANQCGMTFLTHKTETQPINHSKGYFIGIDTSTWSLVVRRDTNSEIYDNSERLGETAGPHELRGDWVRVVVEFVDDDAGTINVTAYEESGTGWASLTVADTTYPWGGLGFTSRKTECQICFVGRGENNPPPIKVTTGDTEAGYTDATLTATLDSLGYADSVDVWFGYRESGESSWTTTEPREMSNTGEFSGTINGLIDNTDYEVKAVVSNGTRDVNGYTTTFTTVDQSPVVSTSEPDSIGYTEVTVTGTLEDLNDASSADVWFTYRETGAESWTETPTEILTTAGSFDETITALTTDTEYEFRAHANTAPGGTTITDTVTFKTGQIVPEVTADDASLGSDMTTADLNGTAVDFGDQDEAQVWFEYGPSGDLSANTTPKETLTETGSFTHSITGLTAEQTYNYRANISTSDGDTSTSQIKSVTTDPIYRFESDTSMPPSDWEMTTLSSDSLSYSEAESVSGDASLRINNGGSNTINHGQGSNEFTSCLRATGGPARPHQLQFNYQEQSSDTGGIGFWAVDSSGNKLFGVGSTNPDPIVYDADGQSYFTSANYDTWYRFDLEFDWANNEFTMTWDGGNSHTGSFIDSGAGDIAEIHVGCFGNSMNGKLAGVYLDDISRITGNLLTTETIGSTPSAASADLTGELVNLGGDSSADVYFEYHETGVNSWETSASQTLSSAGTFTESVSGLSPETEYEYRAVAESDTMTEISNSMTFTTTPDTTIETGAADVGSDTTTATLTGELIYMGDVSSADVSIQYGPTGNVTANETAPATLESTGYFAQDISGLTEGEDYDFRARANTPDGDTMTGGTQTFTVEPIYSFEDTRQLPPEGWQMTGLATDYLSYSQDEDIEGNYVLYINDPDNTIGHTGGVDEFTSSMKTTGGPAYIREIQIGFDDRNYNIYSNTGGVGFWAVDQNGNKLFAVGSANPELMAYDADGQTQFGSGEDGADHFYDVEIDWVNEEFTAKWGSWGSETQTTYTGSFIDSGAGGIAEIHVGAFGDAMSGNMEDVWLDEITAISGSSLIAEPTGATPGMTTADVTGELVSLGGASSADVYFEYRETGADVWQTSATQTLSSAGTFTESLSGLTDQTDYEYRTVAEAGSTTDTSSAMTFTTTPDTTVVTQGVDVASSPSSAVLTGEVTALGDASSVDAYFDWGPIGDVTANQTSASTISQPDTYESGVFGLTEGNEYSYRAHGDASDGDEVLGETKTFTAVTTKELTESFESGNVSDSSFTSSSSSSVTSNHAYDGSYSFNASDGGTNIQATASPFGGNVFPSEVSFYYRETSNYQNGGGLRLLNESGDPVCGWLTNNPQWEVVDANGNSQFGEGAYDTWTRVRFHNFDFANSTFDITVEYADGSSTAFATGRPMITDSPSGVATIEITRYSQYTGNVINMFFDQFYVVYEDSGDGDSGTDPVLG